MYKKVKRFLDWILLLIILLAFSCPVHTSASSVNTTGNNTDTNEKPRVIITDYNISSEKLIPDDIFELNLTLKNTSKDLTVTSVLVSVNSVNTDIVPQEGVSNQQYIDSIQPSASVTVTFKLKVADAISDTISRVTITNDYTCDMYGSLSNSAYIAISLTQENALHGTILPLSSTTQYANSLVSVSVSNDSLDSLYNVTLNLEGDFPESQKKVDFGILATGEQRVVDHYVIFQNNGSQALHGYFTYEDKDGNPYITDAGEYIVNVAEYQEQNNVPNPNTSSNDNNSFGLWELCLISGIVILVVIVIILLIRKK